MRGQLTQVEARVAAIEPVTGDSIPLVIQLRSAALAKTKRPHDLLKKAGVSVQAAEQPGQLIAEVDSTTLSHLRRAFDNPTTKTDRYGVSTVEHFSVWLPSLAAKKTSESDDRANVVAVAAASGKGIRLELFPWLSLDSPLTTGETLRDHLADAGFSLVFQRGNPRRRSYYFDVNPDTGTDVLAKILGIRSAVVSPDYGAYQEIVQQSSRNIIAGEPVRLPAAPTSHRSVGVLDSGISVGVLDPWVEKRYSYDVGVERNTEHGTFVAGLIAASRELNQDLRFPADTAAVVDAQVLPSVPISEDLLLDRIEEVIRDQGSEGPRVWNCSFSGRSPLDPVAYSPIAQAMDEMSAKHNILFVQAAGNYTETPRRSWPPTGPLRDGIASPADAIRSLTVGSLAHNGGFVPAGSPASYSRRGPSFGGQQKPDVVHWSGDFSAAGVLAGHGIYSIAPGDVVGENVGTSFATPIVSAVAANIWDKIERSEGSLAATPELVKGLVVHAAALNTRDISPLNRNYFGAGVPQTSTEILGNSPDMFTTVHDVTLSRGVDWLRTPFPVPACLLTAEGKLRAEITMTLSYSPLVDPAFGDESVRTSVDASFGRVLPGKSGPTIKGIVPLEKDSAAHTWEKQAIAEGKWSPLRTYRATYPQGHQPGEAWGLKLSLLERGEGELQTEQRVFVILTFRGLEPDLPVYEDGIAAINQYSYPSLNLDVVNTIRVEEDV